MHSERALLELVGLVYEAAFDSAQWVTFLERLSRILRTPLSARYVRDLADGHRSVTAEVRLRFRDRPPNVHRACVEFHKTERRLQTPSSEQVRQPIFREGLYHWRNYDSWLGPLKDSLGDALIGCRK
jgi:hypothetical protein